MTLSRTATRQFERMSRAHALLLTCVCISILCVGLASPRQSWTPPDWRSKTTGPDEDDVDATLREAATAALRGHEGTIIVMDPQTGRVRALVNPQLAYAQALMPGSTMKSFAAVAALRSGLIETGSRTVCPGRFTGLSFSLPCVHANHLPPFTPAQAIAYSCNYYFATLGKRLGRDELVDTLRPFGFGRPTGVDEHEEAGTLRPCETGNAARIRAENYRASPQSDCAARAGVGESDHISVTPIQLLAAYAALLNDGHLFQPRIAGANDFHRIERGRLAIAPEHRAIVAEGMRGAVLYGTAKRAGLDALPLSILGKTGTSLPPKGFRSNGWFVGLTGARKPLSGAGEINPEELSLAVLVFLTRANGLEAATASRSIFEAYASAIRSQSNQQPSNVRKPPSQFGNRHSAIRIHLVTENVTHELSLEDYVLGVMRAEGSTETEAEALKALAIAIRTFTMTNRGRHTKDGYDFCSTTHCQRFLARPTVREGSFIDAARATNGQILLDDRGQGADAYFSASCGGETANLGTLWGKSPPPYLRGVRDEFCVTGPHAAWNDVITRANLLRALQSDARTDVGARLDNIIIDKRDETGRAEFITLAGEQRKSVRGWDFKIIVGRVLGWNLLKSSRFQVSRAGTNFIFRGSGFGHGLGLCQEGAHVMAQGGAGYQRILEKYFPGTRIKRDAETRGRGDAVRSNSQPRSGEMFIAQNRMIDVQLRRSAMFSNPAVGRRLHHAPTELSTVSRTSSYKHSVPTELGARPRFLTLSSEHFCLTYPANVDRRDADSVLDTLESARTDFLRRASAASMPPGIPTIEVRLNNSTGDFTARTGQPWWAAAATRGKRIELQPVAVLRRRGVLANTLRHELAHVVIDTVSRGRAPRWLEEGFAIHLAGEGPIFSFYVRRGGLIPEELEKKLASPSSQQEMRALYAQAYSTVLELVKNGTETSVWKKIAAS